MCYIGIDSTNLLHYSIDILPLTHRTLIDNSIVLAIIRKQTQLIIIHIMLCIPLIIIIKISRNYPNMTYTLTPTNNDTKQPDENKNKTSQSRHPAHKQNKSSLDSPNVTLTSNQL